jgi:hypothetical protein
MTLSAYSAFSLQPFLRSIASRLTGPPLAVARIKTGEAEQDCRGSTIEKRMEYRCVDATLEHVPDEVGKCHLAREDEGNRPREQSKQEQRAADQFDDAGGGDQGWNIRKIRNHGDFENFGDAILKQQQAGHKAKQAERRRLIFCEDLVHVLSPSLTNQA